MSFKHKLEGYERIVFYDGDCGFCNKSVEIILKYRKKDFYFVALQSELAKYFFSKKSIDCNLDTMYFLTDNQIFERSKAAIKIGKDLKFPYSFFAATLGLFPLKIADFFYNFIAKNRKKILRNKCYLPHEKERFFFLS